MGTVTLQCAGGAGNGPVVTEPVDAGSVRCDGGSRSLAMLTRQPVCENEMVPSLHSNLGDAASAAGAGLASTAAFCGAGAWATGFSNEEAQPAHQTESNKTRSIRICASVRRLLQRADTVGAVGSQTISP